MNGVILWGSNNGFQVYCEDGSSRRCVLKGKRLKNPGRINTESQAGIELRNALAMETEAENYNALSPGDKVVIACEGEVGSIVKQLPRKNCFGRYNEGGRAQQAIAANLDLVICLSTPCNPPFRPRFIDRMAVIAEAANIPFRIVLNKADLGANELCLQRLQNHSQLGYPVDMISCISGDNIEAFRNLVAGKTTLLVGQSGVGKSTLLNMLSPKLQRKTGEISGKMDRGRHVTTMAEMLILDDQTRIVDSPGIRKVPIRDIKPQELDAYFPELKELAPLCDFGHSCSHSQPQGCRIFEAVTQGSIHPDRYRSYLYIRKELETQQTVPGQKKSHIRLRRSLRGDGARKHLRRSSRVSKQDGNNIDEFGEEGMGNVE